MFPCCAEASVLSGARKQAEQGWTTRHARSVMGGGLAEEGSGALAGGEGRRGEGGRNVSMQAGGGGSGTGQGRKDCC